MPCPKDISGAIGRTDACRRRHLLDAGLFGHGSGCLDGFMLSTRRGFPDRLAKKGSSIIGKGDLSYKVGSDKPDEIGELRAFDDMSSNLSSHTTALS